MLVLSLILISLFFGWWLSTSDYAFSFSGLFSTRYFNASQIIGISMGGLILGGLLTCSNQVNSAGEAIEISSPIISLTLAFSAFFAVLLTYKISKLSSVIYALVGSLVGWQYYNTGTIDWGYLVKNSTVWTIAPLITIALSYFVTLFYKKYIVNTNLHYLKLNQYLKIGIYLNAIVLALLIGINNGEMLILLIKSIKTNYQFALDTLPMSKDYFIYLAAVLLIVLFTFYKTQNNVKHLAQANANASTETTLVVISVSNLVILLFSTPLLVIPLSFPQIIMAAVLGNALTKQNIQIEIKKIARWMIVFVLAPSLAFFISYFTLHLISKQYISQESNINNGDDYNIINIATPLFLVSIIILLVGVIFYLAKENKLKLKAQKEVLKHQENLFENQKSLSAMEVKTILLENDKLNTKLELKRKELTNIALNITEQKAFLEKIHQKLKNLKSIDLPEEKNKKLDELEREVFQKMNFSQEIEHFYTQIENLHKDFNIRLTEHHPHLTENDKRLVTLLRLGFSTKHISSLTNISPKSVEIARYRLRSKLGLSHEQNLINYLKTI